MKTLKLLLLTAVLFFSITIFAQNNSSCRGFAKEGITILDTAFFVHDGRYNAVKLAEGDKIDVYKPFYKGRRYMITVIAEDNLPGINIKIDNIRRENLHHNEESGNRHSWIFEPTKNENLIISVEVLKEGEKPDLSNRGCVAVLIGYSVS